MCPAATGITRHLRRATRVKQSRRQRGVNAPLDGLLCVGCSPTLAQVAALPRLEFGSCLACPVFCCLVSAQTGHRCRLRLPCQPDFEERTCLPGAMIPAYIHGTLHSGTSRQHTPQPRKRSNIDSHGNCQRRRKRLMNMQTQAGHGVGSFLCSGKTQRYILRTRPTGCTRNNAGPCAHSPRSSDDFCTRYPHSQRRSRRRHHPTVWTMQCPAAPAAPLRASTRFPFSPSPEVRRGCHRRETCFHCLQVPARS